MRTEPEEFNVDERNLLLFLETCLVDGYGRVASVHMNAINFDLAEKMQKEGLISFGRLTMKAIRVFNNNHPSISRQYTHWVRFTDKAWNIVHQLRRQRSDRMIESIEEQLESEKTR